MRVLLTDGSGLTSRQVATQLGELGHHVEVLTSDLLSLSRFTKHVHKVHRVPAFGTSPFQWLDTAVAIMLAERFDLLFPTQEQVAVIARCSEELKQKGVASPVPTFSSLMKVQDKVSAFKTMNTLEISQPQSTIVDTGEELAQWTRFPVFVKKSIGTASTGVLEVTSRELMAQVAAEWNDAGVFNGPGVLVQQPVQGPLVMVQSVFSKGRLIAFHEMTRVREGAGGGASHKRSVTVPGIRESIDRLGSELQWHGALSADVIVSAGTALFIDINPRLVEPGNASRSGVDLVGAMISTAFEDIPDPVADGLSGIRTHQLLLAIGGAAQQAGTRRAILTELFEAARHRGDYEGSAEELTPLRRDLRTVIPVAVGAIAVLARPRSWEWFSSGAVSTYALSLPGWESIIRGR